MFQPPTQPPNSISSESSTGADMEKGADAQTLTAESFESCGNIFGLLTKIYS